MTSKIKKEFVLTGKDLREALKRVTHTNLKHVKMIPL